MEVEWSELSLLLLLDKYAKILHVSPFSKRWRNDEVAEAEKFGLELKIPLGDI